jgi:uncharacterized membrane protein (DUF485 family)
MLSEPSSESASTLRLKDLAKRRTRMTLALAALMATAYFGFIALVAFARPQAKTLLGGRVSVGIVVGASVIILAPVLVAIYVRWANRLSDSTKDMEP